ncbi:MAG: hypothetical protein QY303_04705 [Vicingaceae bacterium]|nr:MAG: hypothetical protein QY303_04705 [Vicingaceae bacterium]
MKILKISLITLTALILHSCGINSFNKYNAANEKNKKWIEMEPHQDSILYIISNYKNGVRNGNAKIYYEDNIVGKGKYKNGLKQGEWLFYKKGILFRKELFKEGIKTKYEEIENGKVVKSVIITPSF